MNYIAQIRQIVIDCICKAFGLKRPLAGIEVTLNVDKVKSAFGDLSCNAAMIAARELKRNPRELAELLVSQLQSDDRLTGVIEKVDIAGPGFINITMKNTTWQRIAQDLITHKDAYFKLAPDDIHKKYLIEFVSANPTGPLHFGHGRNGIIGDVLSRILTFLGHNVTREFYINDAGNQIKLLGLSLKARCQQVVDGKEAVIPEGGYGGQYMLEAAEACVKEHSKSVITRDDTFFADYAKAAMLKLVKDDLDAYRISFDRWFSEKTLHDGGQIDKVLELLKTKSLVYEQDNAWWFKATEFGDDKDRVVKKSNGELTYIAADIAYHQDKFDRGYDKMINILGQDHHGYVKRLKATMQAMGYDADKLDVILYQLVTLKENEQVLRMSKRAGTFTKLHDVIDAVGADVTRFFYLNRKAEAFLEFDLGVAYKRTDENPVFYIQYAYVRMNSLLEKASQEIALQTVLSDTIGQLGSDERVLLRHIMLLYDMLRTIEQSYQTHILAYYTLELAHAFHNYYTNNRIIDVNNVDQTCVRLQMIKLVRQTLGICLDLLGISKPEKM